MSKCWYNIKLDTTNCLNPSWQWPTPTTARSLWSYSAFEVFNPGWLSYAMSAGIDIDSAMLFYKKGPTKRSNDNISHVDVHRDDINNYVTGAINWVMKGSTGSKMAWYKLPEGKPAIRYTPSNTPYIGWPVDKLELIEEYEIGTSPVLVRTNLPHDVYDILEERWCMSIRLIIPGETDWESVVDYMRSKNLLVESGDIK